MDWIVSYGNIVDGISFYGPFTSSDLALEFCEGLGGENWQIIDLLEPF